MAFSEGFSVHGAFCDHGLVTTHAPSGVAALSGALRGASDCQRSPWKPRRTGSQEWARTARVAPDSRRTIGGQLAMPCKLLSLIENGLFGRFGRFYAPLLYPNHVRSLRLSMFTTSAVSPAIAAAIRLPTRSASARSGFASRFT